MVQINTQTLNNVRMCIYNNILLGVIIFCKTTNKNSFQSFVKVGDMMDVTQNIKVHSLE